MKDNLLYLTIGLLIGIVVMQWTMPSGQATIVTPPVGSVVALLGQDKVLTSNGELWTLQSGSWQLQGSIPLPVNNVQFVGFDPPEVRYPNERIGIIDKSGNLWQGYPGNWTNYGGPPVQPVPTSENTWGGVKGKYEGHE
jgi:hypothetical protein